MGMDLLSSIEIIVCLVRASLLEGRPGTRRSRLLVLVLFLPEEDPRLCTCSNVGVQVSDMIESTSREKNILELHARTTYTDKMKSIADEHSLHSLIQRRV